MPWCHEFDSREFLIFFFANLNYFCSSHDKDDSINGSKTQSTATTESNTPENTIRIENMGHHKSSSVNYTIENNEVVLESK